MKGARGSEAVRPDCRVCARAPNRELAPDGVGDGGHACSAAVAVVAAAAVAHGRRELCAQHAQRRGAEARIDREGERRGGDDQGGGKPVREVAIRTPRGGAASQVGTKDGGLHCAVRRHARLVGCAGD